MEATKKQKASAAKVEQRGGGGEDEEHHHEQGRRVARRGQGRREGCGKGALVAATRNNVDDEACQKDEQCNKRGTHRHVEADK